MSNTKSYRSVDMATRQHLDREAHERAKETAHAAWSEFQKTGLHLTAQEADGWLARLEAGEDLEPPGCHD